VATKTHSGLVLCKVYSDALKYSSLIDGPKEVETFLYDEIVDSLDNLMAYISDNKKDNIHGVITPLFDHLTIAINTNQEQNVNSKQDRYG
jgi:hypothetical protein